MKKFLLYEWSYIKSKFKDHPLLFLYMCFNLLLICVAVFYLLFSGKYNYELNFLLIFFIFLMYRNINRLNQEIARKDRQIRELERENSILKMQK